MKKKILLVLFILSALFIISPTNAFAACTQVATNQTTCSGTQTVACMQSLPTPGNIRRWCCDDQTSCDAAKGAIQQQIQERINTGSDNTADIHGECGETGINTAIGCINFGSQNTLFGDLLRWAVGIGGGIAFLLIVYAGFLIMTSAGNPDRLKAGQELLTSALSGLILLIFSIFILRFIGIDILGLNQFGFGQ